MLLYGLRQDSEFGHLNVRLLVSCPSDPGSIGGLFLLDFANNSIRRLFTGDCRGMAIHEDRLFLATNTHGVVELDREYRQTRSISITGMDVHGLAVWQGTHLLLVESAVNAIGCYSLDTFERTGEIRMHESDRDEIHLNDMWLRN